MPTSAMLTMPISWMLSSIGVLTSEMRNSRKAISKGANSYLIASFEIVKFEDVNFKGANLDA